MLSFRSLVAIAAFAAAPGLAYGQLNLVCSVPADWCRILADEFQKDTGVKVTIVTTGGRAVIAALAEQKGRPESDVWYGGSADTHIRAGKFAIVDEYKSPMATQLEPWAQKVVEQSSSQSVGVYARVIGIGYNTAVVTQKKLAPPACWKDLIKPGYAGEVNIADPSVSPATHFAIAAMAQLFGEDEAYKYLKTMYRAPPSAKKARAAAGEKGEMGKSAPPGFGKAIVRGGGKGNAGDSDVALSSAPVGSAVAGIGFVGDIVAEAEGGASVKAVTPCEGTVYEVGAVSVIKGARNLDNAKKFVDWALGAKAQGLSAKARPYVYPANTQAAVSPLAPKFGDIKFINYDAAKFEKTAARRHLIDRWSTEINASAP